MTDIEHGIKLSLYATGGIKLIIDKTLEIVGPQLRKSADITTLRMKMSNEFPEIIMTMLTDVEHFEEKIAPAIEVPDDLCEMLETILGILKHDKEEEKENGNEEV